MIGTKDTIRLFHNAIQSSASGSLMCSTFHMQAIMFQNVDINDEYYLVQVVACAT